MDLKEKYQKETDKLAASIRQLRHKNRQYVGQELLTFCLAVAAFAAYCLKGLDLVWLLATVLLLLGYIVVRRRDVANGQRIDSLTRLRLVYEREIQYLEGHYACFSTGECYTDPRHAFTYDMDVFGADSLFNRIDRTVTTGGSDALAQRLSTLPADVATTVHRREAISELAAHELWLTTFLAKGQSTDVSSDKANPKIDSKAILGVIREVSAMNIAPFAQRRSWLLGAVVSLVVLYVLTLLSVFTSMPATIPVCWGILQLFGVLMLVARPLKDISKAVGRLIEQLQAFADLVAHVATARFESSELKGLQQVLLDEQHNALHSFGQLSAILSSLDRRSNVLGLVLLNVLCLSDFFLVRKFLKWQQLYLGQIGSWIDSLSQIDAYVSMAVMQQNEPKARPAEVVEAKGVVYEAIELWHPFLGNKAVSNDFMLKDRNYYIITGANMAGKSTFLRAIGINYLLAMNGMVVFAQSLRVSVFNLFSSMRTTDDLSHGISYFNAELLRLRQLISSCKQHDNTLIILDEILKGTNSLDKLNGSRLFLQEITRLPVTGLIATHDLELSKMEDLFPERFHNYCFEIGLAERITYSYKISKGVARNQNATFLLKRIIDTMDA